MGRTNKAAAQVFIGIMETSHSSTEKATCASNSRTDKRLGFLLALASVTATLAVVEIGLRAFGFSYNLYPAKIEFGWPNPTTMQNLYLPDDDLLWVPKNYSQRVADLKSHPPTVLFMGDSCTEFGNYDAFFTTRAAEAGLGVFSSAKLGVGGWSSFQGLQQLRRDIAAIRPKVVTIYFGWNDHWIGFGIQDKEIARLRSPLFTLLEHSRVAQLVTKAIVLQEVHEGSVPLRVSLTDFRTNLEEMVQVARGAGITPVLLTAPSSHRVGEEPEYLSRRHVKDLSQLVPLHRQYVDVVREVAAQASVPLCDLFDDFAQLPGPEQERCFSKDGIHLTKGPGGGYDKLAQFLVRCFKKQGINLH